MNHARSSSDTDFSIIFPELKKNHGKGNAFLRRKEKKGQPFRKGLTLKKPKNRLNF